MHLIRRLNGFENELYKDYRRRKEQHDGIFWEIANGWRIRI